LINDFSKFLEWKILEGAIDAMLLVFNEVKDSGNQAVLLEIKVVLLIEDVLK